MKVRGSSYFLIAIMVIMLVVIGLSLRMEYPEPKLLPIVVAAAVLALASLQLRSELSAGSGSAVAGVSALAGARSVQRRELSAWAWVMGFFMVVYTLGFGIAIALLAASFVKRDGRGWPTAITFAVLSTALVYAVFELGLGVKLYRGLLFILLGY